ncbi:MAG: penicillin-binding transpeptidase domain-containing protein [Tissierellia bacterium]|nr:penicillin-binding transpeptidase domain-containing protein [Tissierellia bacterium]
MKRIRSNRIIVVSVVVGICFLALLIKLFDLTIAKGDYYRDLSDNKKIKEIDKIASRGNIYDRNGEILATTVSSFSVQLFKDEVFNMKTDKRNETLKKLAKILENDGVNYSEDFAISLNSLSYDNADVYFKEKVSPEEKAIDILIDNNLMYQFVNKAQKDDEIDYEVANSALYALKRKGIDLPISISLNENNEIQAELDDRKDLDKILSEYNFSQSDDPIYMISQSIGDDKSVIRNILENPLARKSLYEVLTENSLQSNIVLDDMILKNDKDYIQKKADLSKAYPNITKSSKAKDDFFNIVKKSSLKTLLTLASLRDDGSYIIPADMLIEKLENKGIYANFTTEVNTKAEDDQNNYSVNISFTNADTGDPVDSLIELADQNGLLYDLITDEDVKYLAQKANIKENIYPSIDVDEWIYTDQKEKDDLLERYKISKKEEDVNKIFDQIKKTNELDEKNVYIANGILSIINKLNSQGNYGYRPVNLVYNLNQKTTAKIEENIDKSTGIEVDTVPVRYYPNRNSSSHILGYMGPIATDEEVKNYIEEKNYLPDELIGKTGIEESYEDTLKGKNGKKIVTVDSKGNRKETLSETDSVPGDDVYLSIDSKLQKTAENSLQGVLRAIQTGSTYESEWGNYTPFDSSPHAQSGAVVVTDVKTGEVLSMVSLPDYDPNLFATGISETDWNSLQVMEDSGPLTPRPMLNLASQTAVQPGSTFKLVTSYAALQQGLDPHQTNYCHGFMDIGDKRFNCLIWTQEGRTHGEENLYDAIRDSCNYYFYTLAMGKNPKDGNDMHVKLELEDIRKAAIDLGLDETTGIEINIPQETKGNIPSIDKKLEVTKSLLAKYLDENLKKYLKDETKKKDSEYKKDIETIVSWCDLDTEISRQEVIDSLDDMGYEALMPIEDQISGLADTIKYSYLNQANWDITDMLNIVIGQGQNSYTPLQMNRMISTIANGGNLNKFTLVDKIKEHRNGSLIFENQAISKKIDVKDEKYLEDIKYGALQVAQNNPVLKEIPVDIGVKTGTAEVEGKNENGEDYDSYSWMVGFAPYDDPQIAVSALITQGGTSYNCSPIVRDVVCSYLDLDKDSMNDIHLDKDDADAHLYDDN